MSGWASFLGVIALLAGNRLLLTLLGDGTRRWAFWSIQLLNFLAACALIVWGLPGVPKGLGIINYFVAGVFLLHVVENNGERMKALEKRIAAAGDVADERRIDLLEKVRAAKAADEDERADEPDEDTETLEATPPSDEDEAAE
jgi:hypothetical protein